MLWTTSSQWLSHHLDGRMETTHLPEITPAFRFGKVTKAEGEGEGLVFIFAHLPHLEAWPDSGCCPPPRPAALPAMGEPAVLYSKGSWGWSPPTGCCLTSVFRSTEGRMTTESFPCAPRAPAGTPRLRASLLQHAPHSIFFFLTYSLKYHLLSISCALFFLLSFSLFFSLLFFFFFPPSPPPTPPYPNVSAASLSNYAWRQKSQSAFS